MCLIALFFRMVEDAGVVVGANREEHYARGGDPPSILEGPVRAVAGTDPVAGGTWLGVNEHGVLIAVTNRPKSALPPQPRSRGLLARELLLECSSAAQAAERAASGLAAQGYAGCNLLCVDQQSAVAIEAGDWMRVRPLPPGLHVLTARDVNDASDPRNRHAMTWLGRKSYAAAEPIARALRELCAQPGNGTPAICMHGEKGGTVSSSIIVLRSSLDQCTYLHTQGPPDRTPYTDYSALLRQIAPVPEKG